MPRRPRSPHGYTLLEMATVLALLGAAIAPALGGARRLVDRMAVEGAREDVAALVARARTEALLRGEAAVLVARDPARALLLVPSEEGAGARRRRTVLTVRDVAAEFGVRILVGGRRGRVELRFDELGLGSMTSRTLRFRRGRSEARLVVSSFGRLRRR